MKVGENQSGLAKVEHSRERRRERRESYPLSGNFVKPADTADNARTADRRSRADAHMALQSDEVSKRCLSCIYWLRSCKSQ